MDGHAFNRPRTCRALAKLQGQEDEVQQIAKTNFEVEKSQEAHQPFGAVPRRKVSRYSMAAWTGRVHGKPPDEARAPLKSLLLTARLLTVVDGSTQKFVSTARP